MKTIIKARGLILNDKKEIFLVKDSKGGKFMLPGGKQEEGETIKETLVREIIEETGIKAKNYNFLGFNEYINQKGKITIQFLFKIDNYKDFLNIDKDKCSHGHEWIESGFFSLDFLRENNLNFPSDLEEIITSSLEKNIFGKLI